jgi:ferric-dicitrate binding protein FerR (iron transport regulator)
MSRPCKGNTARLVALMQGSLRPADADRMRNHLEGCRGCSAAYERITRAQHFCRELGRAEPPSLSWRLIEAQINWQLAKEEKQPRRLQRRWLPAMAALFAIAVAGILGVLYLTRSPVGSRQQGSVAAVQSAQRESISDEELAAVVTLVQGEVSVISTRGRMVPLELDRPLLQGTKIITHDGRAAIQWAEESGLLVVHDTELDLSHLHTKRQRLHLAGGKAFIRLSGDKHGRAFEIRARGIRLTVKGTFFSVTIGPRTVDVDVFRGRVHVDPLEKQWAGLDVPGGFRVQIPFGANHPPRLLPLASDADPSQLNLQPWASFQRVMATTGLLTVDSIPPGAEIKLDSHAIGTTNLRFRSPLGRHFLELWREGKLVEKQWVEIQTRQNRLALDIRKHLEPHASRAKLPDRFHRIISQRSIQIQGCYERLLKQNPDLTGKLIVRIKIDGDGKVSKVLLIGNTFKEPRVGRCAQHVIERWTFPPGKAAEVVYPFIFRAQ